VKMLDLVAQLPQLEDVTSNLAITSPQVDVTIDRDKAAACRPTPMPSRAHFTTLRTALGITIYAAVNEYKVLLELQRQYQADPKALSLLYS